MSNETKDQVIIGGKNDGKFVNKSYMEARRQAANYTAPYKIKMDQRRAFAMKLRREDRMTIEAIADYIKSQDTKYLEEGQNYTAQDVIRDLRNCLRTLTDETQELAKGYLADELADLEAEQDEVRKLADDIRNFLNNTAPTLENIDDYEKASRVYDRMMDRLDRIRDRRGKYLPMEAPKQVDIRSQNVYGSVDDFLKLKKEQQEIEENTVEGEFVET